MKPIPKELYIALKELEDHGYEAFLVGGAVRNYVLNTPIKDYDITTNADPNAIKMVFNKYRLYDIGKKHGTIAVLIGKYTFEITPYRLETRYKDHRHPDKVIFTNELKNDLKRRDFTINALCLDSSDNIIDLFNGIDDINNKLIRAIGNPHTRFNEDALRILRALRFKAKLNFEIEEKTRKELFRCKDLLSYISYERKKDELLQILESRNAFRIINEYLDIFNTFIPFKHTKRKINNFSSAFYALAFLLKDTDKPNLKQMKFSNQEIDLLKTLIQASKIDIDDDYQFISCLSDFYQKQILQFLEQYHRLDLQNRFKSLKKYMCTMNDLKIDGKQIESYGYKEKQIGQIKKQLLELVHHKKLHNTVSSLNKHLKKNIL